MYLSNAIWFSSTRLRLCYIKLNELSGCSFSARDFSAPTDRDVQNIFFKFGSDKEYMNLEGVSVCIVIGEGAGLSALGPISTVKCIITSSSSRDLLDAGKTQQNTNMKYA